MWGPMEIADSGENSRGKKRSRQKGKGNKPKGKKRKGPERKPPSQYYYGGEEEDELGDGEGSESEHESEYSDDSDSESEGQDRSEKLHKAAAKLAKKNVFVHLGMLWSPTDHGYEKAREQTKLELSGVRKVKAKSVYTKPNTWFDFSVLFSRLIGLFLQKGHDVGKVVQVLAYFERLTIKMHLQLASVEAIVDYDHRVRKANSGSWNWLTYDHEIFEIAKAANRPVRSEVTHGSQRETAYRGASRGGAGRPRTVPTRGGPWTDQERSSKGPCHAWRDTGRCRFDSLPEGCRFAHWCTKAKCKAANEVNHRPDACPN